MKINDLNNSINLIKQNKLKVEENLTRSLRSQNILKIKIVISLISSLFKVLIHELKLILRASLEGVNFLIYFIVLKSFSSSKIHDDKSWAKTLTEFDFAIL